MTWSRVLGPALATLTLLAACRIPETDETDPAGAGAPPSGLVFASDRSGVFQIYSMKSDGTSVKRITRTRNEERHPRVSPDGRRIVFQSVGSSGSHIAVMSLDGTGIRRLTFGGLDGEPDWSSDGERVVFSSERGGTRSLHVVNVDGSGLKRLGPDGVAARSPAWSPDGRRIAFSGVIDDREEVFVMNSDATRLRRLTRRSAEDSRPGWFPDGRRLVINSTRLSRNDDLEVLDLDGKTVRQLTDRKRLAAAYTDRNIACWGARVGPGGRRIVFTSIRDGNAEIYLMDASGGAITRLTDDDAQDDMADWIPGQASDSGR